MKRVMLTICLVLILLVSGCVSSQSTAMFRGQRIVIGQSNDAVEEHLGPPDWAAMNYNMEMTKHFTGYTYGPRTVEWGYRDSPKSLVLWFEHGTLYVIWLIETNLLK